MASGFFMGGLAKGFDSGFSEVNTAIYDQGLLKLAQQREQNQQQNQQRAEFMKLRADGISHLQETMSQLRLAHPDWTEQQLAANPAVVSLKNMLGGFDKNLGLPDTIDSIVAGFAANPQTTERAGLAKERAQTTEATARAGYMERGGLPASTGADPNNPDGPLPGEGLGDHASAEDALKQKYGARTIFKAEQYLHGDRSVLTGLGYGKAGTAAKKQIQDAATDLAIARGMKPEEVNAEIAGFMGQKRAASAAGLRVGNVTVAMDAAQAASKRVLETSAKVDRTAYPSLNSVILAAKKGTGDPNVVQYGIAVNTLVNNYARAVGGGNAQLTDAARQEAYDNLNAAWSKGQIGAAVEQINKEIASELSGAQKAMKDVTTKPKGDGEWKVERID